MIFLSRKILLRSKICFSGVLFETSSSRFLKSYGQTINKHIFKDFNQLKHLQSDRSPSSSSSSSSSSAFKTLRDQLRISKVIWTTSWNMLLIENCQRVDTNRKEEECRGNLCHFLFSVVNSAILHVYNTIKQLNSSVSRLMLDQVHVTHHFTD